MDPQKQMTYKAFIISMALHAVILFPLTGNSLKKTVDKKIPQFDYLVLAETSVSRSIPSKASTSSKKKSKRAYRSRRMTKQTTAKKVSKEANHKASKQLLKTKKILTEKRKPPTIATKKQTDVSLKNNKSYVDYYSIINNQLRQSVVTPESYNEGEVAVSFVVTADGLLKEVQIADITSTVDSVLRKTAVDIIRNASPFPPFPDELRRIKLTFNVVICFQDRG